MTSLVARRMLDEAVRDKQSATSQMESAQESALLAKQALQGETKNKVTALKESMGKLPHFSRYSRTNTFKLDSGSELFKHLAAEFKRTRTRHRGPSPGDPVRRAPEFEVSRIERIVAPRLGRQETSTCDPPIRPHRRQKSWMQKPVKPQLLSTAPTPKQAWHGRCNGPVPSRLWCGRQCKWQNQ